MDNGHAACLRRAACNALPHLNGFQHPFVCAPNFSSPPEKNRFSSADTSMLVLGYRHSGDVDMQAIERESGIAMPKPRVVYAYPYEDMEIGDSFTVPVEARAKVLNANYRAGKRLQRVFVARTEGDLIRVWRMA